MKNVLIITVCTFLAISRFSGTALAANYHCHLPLDTTSAFKNGVPKTETSLDDTIRFDIITSPDGSFASIDGFKFFPLKGPGYLTFYGTVNAAANGFDVVTIYDAKVGEGQFAVESRQVTILGQPMASQMVGVCAPW